MGRPTGTKDSVKRKTKSFWRKSELKQLEKVYAIYDAKELSKMFNKSKGSIAKAAKELNLMKVVPQIITYNPDDINMVGVYGILNMDNSKMYIGSSENMPQRLKNHIYLLNSNTHTNKELQQDWNNKDKFRYVQLCVCDRKHILEYERRIIHTYSRTYNKNISKSLPAIGLKYRNKYFNKLKENEFGCLVWTGHVKRGYGVFKHLGKDIFAHRMFYYWATGDDPGAKIIRHKCHNKLCCNSEHLEVGNYGDNALDNKQLELEEIRDYILYLRNKKYSMNKIAKILDTSIESISKFCRRYNLGGKIVESVRPRFMV